MRHSKSSNKVISKLESLLDTLKETTPNDDLRERLATAEQQLRDVDINNRYKCAQIEGRIDEIKSILGIVL